MDKEQEKAQGARDKGQGTRDENPKRWIECIV
jgi:hypothetical protein